MVVLLFPKTTIELIDKPRKGMFWKGAVSCSGGDCQIAWETACRSKDDGGLGLKDLATQNKSLMLKNVHKLYNGDTNPWAVWIRHWYWEGRAAVESPCWRAMKSLLPTYRSLTTVALADGASTFLWYDSWCTEGPFKDVLPALFSHCRCPQITVRDAVAGGTHGLSWRPRLSSAAAHKLTQLNAALPGVALVPGNDGRLLTAPPSTVFRVATIYPLLRPPTSSLALGNENWNNFAPTKVKISFWLLRHGRTRTRESLHRHGCLDTAQCPFCDAVEDCDHLFVRCPRLAPLWARATTDGWVPADVRSAAHALALALAGAPPELGHTAILLFFWCVWKSRNRMIFDQALLDADAIASMATHLKLWICRAPRRLDTDPLLSSPGVSRSLL